MAPRWVGTAHRAINHAVCSLCRILCMRLAFGRSRAPCGFKQNRARMCWMAIYFSMDQGRGLILMMGLAETLQLKRIYCSIHAENQVIMVHSILGIDRFM